MRRLSDQSELSRRKGLIVMSLGIEGRRLAFPGNAVPCWIRVSERVVVNVRIPVQALGIPRLRHQCIRTDEAAQDGVVVAGTVVV